MIRKKLFFTLIFSLIFVFNTIPLQAGHQWQTRRFEITITPQKPPSYQGTNQQFLANPVYMQGEKATFDITFRELPSRWFFWSTYIDIPQQNLLVTFPNQKERVGIRRISTGRYIYISPELTRVGNRNHTLSVSVIIPPSILNRNLQIIAANKCSISVARLSLNIRITSPANGALLNANPLTVTGTVDDNRAVVTVNNRPAVVQNNQFSAQIPVIEGQNNITARAYLNDELLEETNINIIAEQPMDPVQITASPLSGESNLQVNFTITTNMQNPITKYEWDFDNDGIFDWQSQQTGDASHTYTEVRIYHPTIKITDNNQTQYSASIPINVYLPRQAQWSINIEDPIDLAVDSQRNLYVLQSTNAQIQKYDKDGNLIDTFGMEGQLSGQFNNPCGISLNQIGNIYIADTGNNMNDIHPITIQDNYAEYIIVR